ncbi:hypothetical protein BCIN_09g03850 [Botrytis cinerea B05.10]|uniref:Transaldolase n=1 Tax=Botryotinia fuckeliana (strain B05.10) TaxID=332648 RepID=A0A384JST9_BOTFB|nr:hypothetical protein BCIN_09g03850 [Botrytis cinerea B05.10]ATZ53551.1 hypothetical protein BCIN_09g03850 [Botrytis cinerea B05.10]
MTPRYILEPFFQNCLRFLKHTEVKSVKNIASSNNKTMAPQNLLELLRSRTVVDCDTMEFEVAKSLGPFTDCTSNQAIAFFELQKPENKKLLQETAETTKKLLGTQKFQDMKFPELAVEVAMVKLQLAIASVVTGFVHVQTNPYHSYGAEKMIQDGQRIISIFKHLDPDFDTKRICLKIPSTWEGLQACKFLEKDGITTLATTLFSIEQAALAGEVQCTYVAPYVNELKVHFDAGFTDTNKAHQLCFEIQQYYSKNNFRTKVLPASLTNIDEIMTLAGVDHITIAPALLRDLAATAVEGYAIKSLFDGNRQGESQSNVLEFGNESLWRISFTRSGKGEAERKLSQAINIFCDMQTQLEAMFEKL